MATVTFTSPTWGELESLGVTNSVTLASSTPIGYQGILDSVTAFEFCSAHGYSLLGHVIGGTQNPSVTWDDGNEEWENDGSEPIFLQIQCDDGLNQSIGEVNIANIGDIMLLLGIVIALLMVQVSLHVFGRN